jgi:hypothetical protein
MRRWINISLELYGLCKCTIVILRFCLSYVIFINGYLSSFVLFLFPFIYLLVVDLLLGTYFNDWAETGDAVDVGGGGSNTYLLTPWSRVLLEKLTGFLLVKKFPAFYATRKFITAVTSARHLSLSCTSLI